MSPHPSWLFSGQRNDRWLASLHLDTAVDQQLLIGKFLPYIGKELGSLYLPSVVPLSFIQSAVKAGLL